MKTIKITRVYAVLGDKVELGYPVYFCAKGDNSGSVLLGYATEDGYEQMSAICEAYNTERNKRK